MMTKRRNILQAGKKLGILGALLSIGLLKPEDVLAAWNTQAFQAGSLEKTLTSLGVNKPRQTREITIDAPEIAENGAQVMLKVSTTLPRVTSIAILIEKNPNALAALFRLAGNTLPTMQTRCKISETSKVHALVQSDGQFLIATREVKVTLGGCAA